MTKLPKTFDCLRMKGDIQAKLHKKWAGLTIAEIQAAIETDLAASQTNIARWWRRIEKLQARRDRESSGRRGASG